MNQRQNDRLLTTRQAAALLQVSLGTLANWRSLGKGPRFCRIGARIRYRESELQSMIVEDESDDVDSLMHDFRRRRTVA